MKRVVFIIFFISVSYCFGQGQTEINDIKMLEYDKSVSQKDSLVNELFKVYSNNSDFIHAFRKSEEMWNLFVDEQFKIKFPAFETWDNRHQIYGSQFEMCYYEFLKRHTDLRILTIRELFIKDDVCGN